jgi:hypothetical protein
MSKPTTRQLLRKSGITLKKFKEFLRQQELDNLEISPEDLQKLKASTGVK